MISLAVVIPTFDRPEVAERCVRAVVAVSPPDTEIIISDDGSPGDAVSRLRHLASDIPRLRVVEGPNGGPAKARNRGWRASNAPIVAFIDDDCVPEPGWAEAILATFGAHPELAGVEGRIHCERAFKGPFLRGFDTTVNNYISGNLALRREALEAVNGFDEGFPFAHGEDVDLCYRIMKLVGGIAFVREASVVHPVITVHSRYFLRRTAQDVSTYRLFARQPECLRAALANVRLTPFLGPAPGGAARFSHVVIYIVTSELLRAFFALRDGATLSERVTGCATFLACIPLSLLQVRRGLAAFRRAAAGE